MDKWQHTYAQIPLTIGYYKRENFRLQIRLQSVMKISGINAKSCGAAVKNIDL